MSQKRNSFTSVLIILALVGPIIWQALGLPLQKEWVAVLILGCAAVLWSTEAVPLFVTSLLVLFWQVTLLRSAMEETGQTIALSEFFAPFFTGITLLFLGGFSLSCLLQRKRVDYLIAYFILKQTKGKPKTLLGGMIVICSFLSMWVSNTATAAMMMALILPIAHSLSPKNPFKKALALSIPFACNIGGLGTPIGTPPNSIALSFLQEAGYPITFLGWMSFAALPLVLGLILLWFILIKVFPPLNEDIALDSLQTPEWDRNVLTSLCVFFASVALWCFADFLALSSGIVGLMITIGVFSCGLLKPEEFKGLPWDILIMVAGGLSLGLAIKLGGLTEPILESIQFPDTKILLLASFGIIAAIMTSFVSNTATASLIIPLAVAIGNHQVVLGLVVAMTCSIAMPLPVSTPPNAIAFNSRIISSKDMFRIGSFFGLILLFMIVMFGTFLWSK